MDTFVDKVVASIEAGVVKETSDLTINLTADEQRKLIGYIIRPFNFLKHADRDPLATLDESDFMPDRAIIHALTAFSMVCPAKPLPDTIAPFLAKHGLI